MLPHNSARQGSLQSIFLLEDLNALFFENNVFNHALEGHNINRKTTKQCQARSGGALQFIESRGDKIGLSSLKSLKNWV